MNNIYKGTIDWYKAIDELSHSAYFMLSVLHLKDFYMTDIALMSYTGLGVSTYRKRKKELVDKKFLVTNQIDKAKYMYIIGDINEH